MKLIILYGSPAVGKLTIANSIANEGFTVFDNHKVIDLIEPIVTRDYENFRTIVYNVHIELLLAAVKANKKDLVTTFPYAANEPDDNEFMSKLIDGATALGAKVYSFHLVADDATLLERVSEPSRRHFGKIKDTEIMQKVLKGYDFSSNFADSDVKIDTTRELPAQIAKRIIHSIIDG